MSRKLKILVSGGGTGGHIFPAVALADELRKRFPESEFLFIGAENRMEMEKVPQAGYKIVGLPIAGFDRGNLLKNISLPVKIIKSLFKMQSLLSSFAPDFAIGTGGYASGPALYLAAKNGVPIFVQEQNSLPGKTNIFLSRQAKAVFTAYPDMDKFFHGKATHFLGNPVRESLIAGFTAQQDAKAQLGLDPAKLLILSVGGSLGSRTLNNAWQQHASALAGHGLELLWQTGKTDFKSLSDDASVNLPNIHLREFISDMALAYSAADIIVSRAGAIAISELALARKPVILVPFPFAAEDHQTQNARQLEEKKAAVTIRDHEMADRFLPELLKLCDDENLRRNMAENIGFFAKPNATENIVDEILNLVFKDENISPKNLEKPVQTAT